MILRKPVKIVVDLMVTSLMDKPAFAARLISVFFCESRVLK